MSALNSRSQIPPGLMRYKHPVSGAEEAFHSWMLLRDWVTRHCEGNGYPPVADEEIEQQMCERMGKAAETYCNDNHGSIDGVTLGWRDIAQGTRTILNFKLAGSPLVSQEEANRRAGICKGCKFNVRFAMPCGGVCGELLEVVERVVGASVTEHHESLQACAVCACHLRAKVWIPLQILKKTENEAQFNVLPSFCWQKDTN